MTRRTRAREVCLQMLFQRDLNPDVDAHAIRQMIDEQLSEEEVRDFCWRLFVGVMEWRAALDERIEAVAANWSIRRMPPTDRNCLRLGAFELIYSPTPHRVVIDEAIELARKYGTAQSAQFVNGILDKLVPEEKRRQPPPEGDSPDAATKDI